jgi:hypothetical protein
VSVSDSTNTDDVMNPNARTDAVDVGEDAFSMSIVTMIRATPGVVQLYPPAGHIPLLSGAIAALRNAAGGTPDLVAVDATDGRITAVRASIGIDTTVTPALVLQQLCTSIRHLLADHLSGTTDPLDDTADQPLITLTIARVSG